MRGPDEIATGEQTGVYRLTVPEGKWELYAEFKGLNPVMNGAQDFLSVTQDAHVAAMSDSSVTQIYRMRWNHAE
jgi:hypothetical protein